MNTGENNHHQKCILITGCSSGIGEYSAKHLAERGYRVFASARRPEDVQRLKDEGLSEAIRLDLNDPASIDEAFSEVLRLSGGELYALINNGGYGQLGALEDLTVDALRDQFETNFFSWHQLVALALPVMRKKGYGRIIQIGSVIGLVGLRNRGAYAASKFAIEGYTDTLRLELEGTEIYASVIEPGPIKTLFRKNAYERSKQFIDLENSHHLATYQNFKHGLETGRVAPFTLKPEHVHEKIIKILEGSSPAPRYYVTFQTYIFGFLKRILPTRWLDRIVSQY